MPRHKRKGEREPRKQWYAHLADKSTSEAAHMWFRDDMVRQLERGERGENASLPISYIVAMADAKHPPADHALRIHIHAAIDADRFNDLPLQVRGYAERALLRPPLPIGYPSNCPQVVNDYVRDIAIHYLVDLIVAHWPAVPKLYGSQTRHSAAWLLALVLTRHGSKLSEQQVRRIYNGRKTHSRRVAEFFIADLPFE